MDCIFYFIVHVLKNKVKLYCRFGFPEVELGILPGWCGTQRLPRLAGLKLALDIIPTGRRVRVPEAVTNGTADKVSVKTKLITTISWMLS